MDVETIAIQYGSAGAQYLTNMLKELGMNKSLKPIVYNDNNSTISHIRSSNRHANARMNVLWSCLRQEFTQNKFNLKFLCGKTLNLSDMLTKAKSGMLNLYYKCARLGQIFVPV